MNRIFTLLFALLFNINNIIAQEQQVLVLYENDFETQNLKWVRGCASDFVSQQTINSMYVSTASARSLYRDATFNQKNTAEILYHDSLETVYRDPQNIAGKYSIAINYDYDRLSLTFKRSDMKDLTFFNVAFDMAAALTLSPNGDHCGVASTTNTPIVNVRLYEHAASSFNASSPPSTYYAAYELEGVAPGPRKITKPAFLEYNWKRLVAPFNILNMTANYLTVTFDLKNATYIAIDNLYIESAVFALPIELVSFKLINGIDQDHLVWEVDKAEDFKGFQIEGSIDGKQWSDVDYVAYEADKKMYKHDLQTNYALYRLKLINKYGSYKYSEVVKGKYKHHEVVVYPNPINDVFKIQSEDKGKIAVYNMQGQLVYEAWKKDLVHVINAQDWEKGLYILKMERAYDVYTQKLLKQ